jgi:hypothetical protein
MLPIVRDKVPPGLNAVLVGISLLLKFEAVVLEFSSCDLMADLLYSGLIAIKFMLGNTDMINGFPSSFGAEFGERASACVELEPIWVNEVESTRLGWL